MSLRQWFHPPRHLLVLFLAVTIIPATTLAWLSWRLLEQDRALASQRVQEQLERAVDLVAADFGRRLADVQELLPTLALSPPAGLANDGLIVSASIWGTATERSMTRSSCRRPTGPSRPRAILTATASTTS